MLSLHRHPLFFSGVVLSSIGALAACGTAGGGSPQGPEPESEEAVQHAAPDTGIPFQAPPWASPRHLAGRVDASHPLSMQVHLRMRDEKAAEAELLAINDPDSPSHGHFLSNQEFEARYAPTEEAVATVSAYLEHHGMRVSHVPDNRAYIAVEGTAQQAETAFGTRLGVYDVGGAKQHAPMDPPKLPAEIAQLVLEIVGLSTTPHVQSHLVRRGASSPSSPSPDAAGAGTCSQWYGQNLDTKDPPYGPSWPALSYAPCGYKPAQIRQAHGFAGVVRDGSDGTGVSIAIVDAYQSPTLFKDAQTYAAHNDPEHPLKEEQFWALMAPGEASTPDETWYAEQTLDVEAVHAMAPGANIVYVGSQSANHPDLIAAVNLVVSKKLATIVSNSYGSIEGFGVPMAAWHSIATQAGLKGIGLYFSSGDSGAQLEFPATLDNVTAVGGTSLALDAAGARVFEVGWETGTSVLQQPQADGEVARWSPLAPGWFVYGSGGGTSLVYEQPPWQAGVVPPALANIAGAPSRVIPDLAMLGDPTTGFLVGQTMGDAYTEYTLGGTSLSCPLFAAVMAIAEQRAKRPLGFSNPQFYKASRTEAFRDVVPGASPQAVVVPDDGTVKTFDYSNLKIRTAAGFDNVTGLGVPAGQAFLDVVK
jgi:subtilase family serine protease